MDPFDWTALGRRYDDRLERLVADGTAVVRRPCPTPRFGS
jgi:hypothetical protein